jgi:hypothetical protein
VNNFVFSTSEALVRRNNLAPHLNSRASDLVNKLWTRIDCLIAIPVYDVRSSLKELKSRSNKISGTFQ